MNEQEPVAWALYPPLDEMPKEPVMIFKCRKDANDEAIESGCDIVPLYRSPTLTDEERRGLDWLGSVGAIIGVAALVLATWAIYKTKQLADFDEAVAHAYSRDTDTVCDLIGEVQDLRMRIEQLEKGGK